LEVCINTKMAWDKAWRRFVNQSKPTVIYIIPCTIARKKFFVVVSEFEAQKAKINTEAAVTAVGDTETAKETWKNLHVPKIKKLKTFIRYQNALRTQLKIEKTLNGSI
jgi:hypothetical protein